MHGAYAASVGCGPRGRHHQHDYRHRGPRGWEDLIAYMTGRGGPFGDPRMFKAFFFGPGGPGHHPRGGPRGRGRARRGDVRAALLLLISEQSQNGYQLIQEIERRTDGVWKPSPGSVYPTLQLLVDEGLIVGTESEGSKRLFELTDEGRAAAEKVETPPWQEIAEGADPGAVNLHTAVTQLMGAVAQSAYAASEEQQQRIVDIVNNARREIYNILGETDEPE